MFFLIGSAPFASTVALAGNGVLYYIHVHITAINANLDHTPNHDGHGQHQCADAGGAELQLASPAGTDRRWGSS